ncbi:MAG: hypothetical protein SVV80_00945 [Planctomycetota bacterium]|nr:hypothetical protein [Planctomycetota bacterium]
MNVTICDYDRIEQEIPLGAGVEKNLVGAPTGTECAPRSEGKGY